MIAIVDYGAGNLRSVSRALAHVGADCKVTSSPDEVLSAHAVVLPGVGAGPDAMKALSAIGLIAPLRRVVAEGKPFLGVCLGLQLLLSTTEEGGSYPCLDIVPGTVRRLPDGLKVPHMGWNQVEQVVAHPFFEGIPQGTHFYFVHSYYPDPDDRSYVAGETEYGTRFCSVLIKDNVIATQFHPEKSGEWGLRLYANFLKWAGLWK